MHECMRAGNERAGGSSREHRWWHIPEAQFTSKPANAAARPSHCQAEYKVSTSTASRHLSASEVRRSISQAVNTREFDVHM